MTAESRTPDHARDPKPAVSGSRAGAVQAASVPFADVLLLVARPGTARVRLLDGRRRRGSG
jgi:hypothetical protein